MRVLSIDPGPHVGLALYDDQHVGGEGKGPGATHYYVERFEAWETTPAKWYAEVEPWVMWTNVVVCEGFNISGSRERSSNVTIEMIGVMRYLAAREHKMFVENQPGAGKRFAGPGWGKLKRLGWYTPGPDHARSAAGHLVLYLAESRQLDAARLLPSDEGEGGSPC